ncbi:hypothetical protein [Rossellomorea sp. NS-SX7]|uniref:hypothetical protein n=1 Tax=Rossellomorea sp. NS-SX7 TaxID=3463856 RepID=UPI004059EDFB
MKKLWFLGLGLSLFLVGCSDTGSEEGKEKESAETSEENTNAAGELMDFYLNLTTTVNGTDIDLNGYEAAVGGETPPTGDELAKLEDAAAMSAEETAKAVESTEIPSGLEDYKKDIEEFKATLAESYTMKAEALKKEGEADLTAADEKMIEAENQIKAILDKAGLVSSSLMNDLNG